MTLYDKFLTSPTPDAIILSDYNKGIFCFDGKRRWVVDDRPTIVDPKKGPLEHWEGCYIFKPNNKEAKELSGGRVKWQDQCKYFYQNLKCKAVIITQGGDGVVGMIDGKSFEYRPKRKVEADSVIGAGDLFAAFLAMGVAHNMDIQEIIALAFEAGAIYVQKKHNESVRPEELLALIDPIGVKFKMPPKKSERKYKLAISNGIFDLIHSGHIQSLQFAKSKADKLLVLVNTDDSARRLKGENRPIIPLEQRMKMIASLQCVDFVVSFEENDKPDAYIKMLQPEVLIKGQDYEGVEVSSATYADEFYLCPLANGVSTSNIIKKIKNE